MAVYSELRSVVVWKIGNERYAKGKGFEGLNKIEASGD